MNQRDGDAVPFCPMEGEDLFDELDYENLNLSFNDLYNEDEGGAMTGAAFSADATTHESGSSPPPPDFATEKASTAAAASDRKGNSCCDVQEQIILGTLVVRVVAARNLEAVHNPGLGGLLFGNSRHAVSSRSSSSSSSSVARGGSANPYASVRFGNTTQRTSEVFDTVDPVWPRGESMYMDVLHPACVTACEDSPDASEASSSSSSVAAISSDTEKKKTEPIKDKGSDSSPPPPLLDVTDRSALVPDRPILTVALFHASEVGRSSRYPNKKGPASGDSDDAFLGMAAVDLTQLFTGKIGTFDDWLHLSGSNSDRAVCRIVCEYEAADTPPRRNDVVQFTGFCRPVDVYPAIIGRRYRVEEFDGGDNVLISCSTPEGWISTYQVHRFMLICADRHLGAVEACQSELISLAERLAHSPLIGAVQESVDRVPDDGLVRVGTDALQNGVSLLSRWWDGGLGRAVGDVAYATNWDGRFNPTVETTDLSATADSWDGGNGDGDSGDEDNQDRAGRQDTDVARLSSTDPLELPIRDVALDPLPNMPLCPITGQPMGDPVVAADGHTYERTAIARWLKTSNRSPLTGSILPHKNVVPNYMLLSSLREVAGATTTTTSASTEPSGTATSTSNGDREMTLDEAQTDEGER